MSKIDYEKATIFNLGNPPVLRYTDLPSHNTKETPHDSLWIKNVWQKK